MTTIVTDRSLSGNDISVYLSLQTTKGAINSNPVFKPFRRTEGKPIQAITYVESAEVKANRQARQQVQDASTFSAELAFELNQSSAEYLDALIHSASDNNTFGPVTTVASTATGFTSTNNDFSDLVVGDWFVASGFTNTALNVAYKISAKASNNAITTVVAPAAVVSAGNSVTFTSIKSSSASSQCYFAAQTRTVDNSVSGNINYDTYFDSIINTGGFEVGESGIVTGTFAMVTEQSRPGVLAVTGQSDAAIDTSDPVSAINNISRIYVDGVDSDCGVKSFGLEVNNNYQGDRAAACDGEQYAYGDLQASGALVTRAPISNTFDWRSRYRDSTAFALACHFTWSDGRWMIVEIMRAKVTEHSMADGSNVVSSNEMSYSAEEDPTTNKTVQIFRSWA